MKVQFNYTYNGQAITKTRFEENVPTDWIHNLDINFCYSNGGYKATLIDDEITVDTSSFEVYEYLSGYFSIKGYLFNQEIEVFGGDSANEDDYNKEYIEEVLENWDGKLIVEGASFKIEQ